MSDRKVIRVEESASDRAARLRREMHAVGEAPTPAKTEKELSDEALAQDRARYVAMPLDDVLEMEIKLGLALPYDKLYASARHQLIKAGVGLQLARAKMGPAAWGNAHDDAEDEDTEE